MKTREDMQTIHAYPALGIRAATSETETRSNETIETIETHKARRPPGLLRRNLARLCRLIR
jgi:hypothetical protein